ncbi:MAG: hypothetical protein ACI4M0_05925 [Christensenellales bacterium]
MTDTALIEVKNIKLYDGCEPFIINDFFTIKTMNNKTMLEAKIEETITTEQTPSILLQAFYLAFPDAIISTYCKNTTAEYYKSLWKTIILFSYYGDTEYSSSKKKELQAEDLEYLKKWHELLVSHHKNCSTNADLHCSTWNYAFNEYLDAVYCGIAEKEFAHLITALEALVVDSTTELNFRTALYTATFYSENAETRESTYNLIKECYNLRSKSVHGDVKDLRKKFKKKEIYDSLFALKRIVADLLFRFYGKEKNNIVSAILASLFNAPKTTII